MEVETLKAKLIAQNQLKTELIRTAAAADRVESSMREGAVAGTELAAGMSLSEDEASALARNLGDANSELAQGAAQGAVYAEGMGEVAQEQAEASAAAAMLQERIERVGDEATQSGVKARFFGESLDDIDAVDLRANLGPLSGTIASVGATAAAATPAILGMVSAVGGLSAGGILAGAGGAALFAGGMQRRAEELAATSEQFADTSEATEAIWANVKEQIDQATAPLQTERSAQFATANLEALVSLSGMAADELASVQDTLYPLLSGLRSSALQEAPEFFDALGDSVERLEPQLSGLESVIETAPDAVRYFTDAAVRLGPELTHLAWSAMMLAGEAGELGLTLGETVLPPLNTMFDVAAWGIGVFNSLPGPIKQAGVAAAVAAGGVALLSGSVYALAAALWTTGIPQIAIAVGLLVGALAGLEAQFGLVSKYINSEVALWNAWVDVAELATNYTLGFAQSVTDLLGPLTMLIPVFGPALYLLGNLDRILQSAGDAAAWLGDKIRELSRLADKYLGPVLDKLDKASEKSEEVGGVNFEFAKIGDDGDGSSNSGSGGDSGDSPPSPPAAPGQTTSDGSGTTVNMSNSKFYGSNKSDVKTWVKEAIEESSRSSRRREDAQGG